MNFKLTTWSLTAGMLAIAATAGLAQQYYGPTPGGAMPPPQAGYADPYAQGMVPGAQPAAWAAPPAGGAYYPQPTAIEPQAGAYAGSDCADGSCGVANSCADCAPSQWWVTGEALIWWTKGSGLPALVTTSPQGTAQPQAGVLGLPTTAVLFGGERVDDGVRAGGRVAVGHWLDGNMDGQVIGRFFGMDEETALYQATSDGNPILAVPFFNAQLGVEDASLVAFPGIVTGTVTAHNKTEVLGAEAMLGVPLKRGCGHRLDLIGGYQFTRINDGMRLQTNLVSIDPNGLVPVGTTIDGFDSFRAGNEFHGGVIGGQLEVQSEQLVFLAMGKVGLGNMHQTLTIDGQQVTTTPGGPVNTFNGNLFAQQTNIGTYQQDAFVVVPEVLLQVTYLLNDRVELSMGYSLMYWSRVATAGAAIDRQVNLSQLTGPLVGPARPAYLGMPTTDFWVMGLNFGASIRF